VSDEEGRVFLRGITSETYGLGEQRRKQRAAPRVIAAGTVTDDASVGHSGDSDEGLSKTAWMLGPGDDPFRTQTLHVHYVELLPGGSNHGHVANEPTTWEFTNGDVLYVPQNTVHQVFADGDEPLRLLVAQNRLFKHLGYDNVVYLEDARAGKQKAAAAAR
jgi:quercetin dioxygenase-like cupin family protein